MITQHSLKIPTAMWIERGSYGPDIEMILYIPVVVAIESKPSASVALREFGQALKYLEKGRYDGFKYDGLIIRIENEPSNKSNIEDLKILIREASEKGIGVIIGNYDPPLQGFENIVSKAKLRIKAEPIVLYNKYHGNMKYIINNYNSPSKILEHLTIYRSFFR